MEVALSTSSSQATGAPAWRTVSSRSDAWKVRPLILASAYCFGLSAFSRSASISSW